MMGQAEQNIPRGNGPRKFSQPFTSYVLSSKNLLLLGMGGRN